MKKRKIGRTKAAPSLLGDGLDESFYAEWLDSYYARDVQEPVCARDIPN